MIKVDTLRQLRRDHLANQFSTWL